MFSGLCKQAVALLATLLVKWDFAGFLGQRNNPAHAGPGLEFTAQFARQATRSALLQRNLQLARGYFDWSNMALKFIFEFYVAALTNEIDDLLEG